jgi:hypothetical protein
MPKNNLMNVHTASGFDPSFLSAFPFEVVAKRFAVTIKLSVMLFLSYATLIHRYLNQPLITNIQI